MKIRNFVFISVIGILFVSVSACGVSSSQAKKSRNNPKPTAKPALKSADPAPAQPAPVSQPGAEGTPAEYMDRYQIVQEKHPEALCNDGTTPVFYFRRGVGDGADKWVIWFKGGGSAHSAETFQGRGPYLTSAKPWMTDEYARLGTDGNSKSADGEANGILSYLPETNPDFYNWNHVYMVYCSSDQWMGTRDASPETGNNYFKGFYIVEAIMDALADTAVIGSPGLEAATHVLLTGSSAGANGLRGHIDRLAVDLSYADVRAISDAGVNKLFNPVHIMMREQIMKEQDTMWQPQLDADCVQAHQDRGESWRCFSGSYLVENGYINTPMFIHQDQTDPKFVDAIRQTSDNANADVDAISAGIRELLADWDGVFSPNVNRHILLNEARFNLTKIEGRTMAETLGNWYFNREGPTNLISQP